MAVLHPKMMFVIPYFAVLCFTVLLVLEPQAVAIVIELPSSGTKCVSEEIQNHVVVLADYFVMGDALNEDGHQQMQFPTISAKVTSPYGNILHHNENVTHGQFAFTSTESGSYLACFWISGQHQQGTTINLDWKTGIAAKDWDSVAKKQKIESVELEITKLEAIIQTIHDNLIYLRDRETEMRGVSETTNARVAWLSIMSLGVCILVSVLQVWLLKHYFQKKKLI